MKDHVTGSHVLNQLGVIIRKEMKSIALDTTSSLRSRCIDGVKSFTWSKVTNELVIHTPTLLQESELPMTVTYGVVWYSNYGVQNSGMFSLIICTLQTCFEECLA